MKATIELTEHEIQQAIRSYVEAGGMKAKKVELSASAEYDRMDRPTGGHSISATVEVEMGAAKDGTK